MATAKPEETRMNLRDLLTNPPGKGTGQVVARYRVIELYNNLYKAAMADEAVRGRFSIRVVKGPSPGSFVALVKVPSEENATDFDVVFDLDYSDPGGNATALARCRVYCNSPSWVFTYGYVAHKMGLLARGWAQALGPKVTGQPPRVRNPSETFGFDKVVHQGALYLLGRGGLVSRADAERMAGLRGPAVSPADPKLGAGAKLKEYGNKQRDASEGKRDARKQQRADRDAIDKMVAEGIKRASNPGAGAGAAARKSKTALRKTAAASRPSKAAASVNARTAERLKAKKTEKSTGARTKKGL
jgi:hypothetical protein